MNRHNKKWTIIWAITYFVLFITSVVVAIYHIKNTNTIVGVGYILLGLNFLVYGIAQIVYIIQENFLDSCVEYEKEIKRRIEEDGNNKTRIDTNREGAGQ